MGFESHMAEVVGQMVAIVERTGADKISQLPERYPCPPGPDSVVEVGIEAARLLSVCGHPDTFGWDRLGRMACMLQRRFGRRGRAGLRGDDGNGGKADGPLGGHAVIIVGEFPPHKAGGLWGCPAGFACTRSAHADAVEHGDFQKIHGR